MYEGTTAILTRGDLASLVATASVCSHVDRDALILMASGPREAGGTQWRAIVERQAESFRATRVVDLPGPADAAKAEWLDAEALLAAVSRAAVMAVDTVVWPLQCDSDLDMISRATEMTILVRQLAELAGMTPPAVETPLVELTNKQMIELGVNLGVAWDQAWSCTLPVETHCGACDGCRARRRKFAVAGIGDPVFTRQLQVS